MHKVRRIMWNYQEADGMQPTQELVLRKQELEVMCREPDTRRQRVYRDGASQDKKT